ncbi:MAG TPA: gamma-glutamyl-gamma-aminobutyrate hydrolase family protein [Gemmataceae bacterium]|nr:gamma-glutamyl-gamma-aminobutyrate hydrolase family protein [Gemmataceae bacterium]
MVASSATLHIGIYGLEEHAFSGGRGCSLWPVGYSAALSAAGAIPITLRHGIGRQSWADVLGDLHGLVWAGKPHEDGYTSTQEQRLCQWCRKNNFPLLAVDHGLHALNAVFGGTLHADLARELPEALQHRHPPERGLRHAINIVGGTRLAGIYGEGEVVVNSEHRRGIARVANGFQVSAAALDGVTEAIEWQGVAWFAMGVQWRPASMTASGLDIQLFRGLVEAAEQRAGGRRKKARVACTSAA